MRSATNYVAIISFLLIGTLQCRLMRPSHLDWQSLPRHQWDEYAGAIGPFQSCPGTQSACPKPAVRGNHVTCKTRRYVSKYGSFHFKCHMLVDAGFSRQGCSSGNTAKFKDCSWNVLTSCHGTVRGRATQKCGVYEVSHCETDSANRCRGTVWTSRTRDFCRRDCNRTKAMVPEVGPA